MSDKVKHASEVLDLDEYVLTTICTLAAREIRVLQGTPPLLRFFNATFAVKWLNGS